MRGDMKIGSGWSSSPLGLPVVEVDGLPFVAAMADELAKRIVDSAASGEGGWVVTPNVDILRRWHRDAAFRATVSGATLFTPDGAPIVWASRLQRDPLPGRLAGSDLFVDLYVRAVRAGLRVALIGGNPGSAEAAVSKLEHAHRLPGGCVRTHCPPFGFERNEIEMQKIDDLLRQWRPAIVFVGLGSPKQENLIHGLRSRHPCGWYLGVGVSFSFVAGEIRRAPVWMRRSGLEWLHRVIQEPGRLARRYFISGMPFVIGLWCRALARSLCGPRTGSGKSESLRDSRSGRRSVE